MNNKNMHVYYYCAATPGKEHEQSTNTQTCEVIIPYTYTMRRSISAMFLINGVLGHILAILIMFMYISFAM